jgi:hypothetical protein
MPEMTLTAPELADIALAPAPFNPDLFGEGCLFLGTVTGPDTGEVWDLWVVPTKPPTIMIRSATSFVNDQHEFPCPHCEKTVSYRGIPRAWSQKVPDQAEAMRQAEHRAGVLLALIAKNPDVGEKIEAARARNVAVARIDTDYDHAVGHDTRTGRSVTVVPQRHQTLTADGSRLSTATEADIGF